MTADTIIKENISPSERNHNLKQDNTDNNLGKSLQDNELCNAKMCSNQYENNFENDLHKKENTVYGNELFISDKTLESNISAYGIAEEDENEMIDADFPPPPAHFFQHSTSSDNFGVFTSIKSDTKINENFTYSNDNENNNAESFKSKKRLSKLSAFSSEKELSEDFPTLKKSSGLKNPKSPEKMDPFISQSRVYKSHENYLQTLHPPDLCPLTLDEPTAISIDALNYQKIENSLDNIEAFLNSTEVLDIINFNKRLSNLQFPHNMQSCTSVQPPIGQDISYNTPQLSYGGKIDNNNNNKNNNNKNIEISVEKNTKQDHASKQCNNNSGNPETRSQMLPHQSPSHNSKLLLQTVKPKTSHQTNLKPSDITSPNISPSIASPMDPSTQASVPNLLKKESKSSLDLSHAQQVSNNLYHLNGFTQSDVSKYLSRIDPFCMMVGRSYLMNFDFSNLNLDSALRVFLGKVLLEGETQEKQRVLSHFSQRFKACNPAFQLSQDSCHTLVCAMLLLNTDYHNQQVQKKMSMSDFIGNLKGLNDGSSDFPKDLLGSFFHSITSNPLPNPLTSKQLKQDAPVDLSVNPFLAAPDLQTAQEYKKGYLMKKNCLNTGGTRTSTGKRNWQMCYVVLKDMIMYLFKDPQEADRTNNKGTSHHKYIRLHHSIAKVASDYQKKRYVFRLYCADQSQYLLQASDTAEMTSWMNHINLVAALLSAPLLPSGVGCKGKQFQRPLMPSACTKFNLREQYARMIEAHDDKEEELKIHKENVKNSSKGSKGSLTADYVEKESYLVFEIERFQIYCKLLKDRINGFSI